MLGFVILFTVLSLALPISGSPRDRRLDAVVQLLQNQLHNDKTSSSDSSSDNEHSHNIVGQNLNTKDIISLIQHAKKTQSRFQVEKDRQKFRSDPNSLKKYIQDFKNKSKKDIEENRIKNRIWDQIVQEEKQPLQKKRLAPNRLLSPLNKFAYENEDRGKQNNGGLSKYSKIFIVLDPIALQNSRNTEDVQNLLSDILEKSSSAVEKSRHDKTEPNHYKGFVIKDAKSRRYRQNSDENEDDDYRPKRSRNDHGGGGGGGGRTAIPYIRHRGDIYEREH